LNFSEKLTDWNGRHDKSVSVKQGGGFSGYISAEVLKEKLLFF